MSKRKVADDDDEDFYDDSDIFDIMPEPTEEVEQDDPSEDGVDEAFLSELGKAKSTPFKRPLKYFVFLLKGKATTGVRIINLPHPKTGILAKFVLNSEGKLLEVQRATGLTSWFLNDKSIADGSVFLTSEIDPLFIFLPILDKVRKAKVGNNGVFVQESALFEDVDRRAAAFLRPFVPLLSLICDVKSDSGESFFRLNDERTILWLHHKLDALCEQLEKFDDVSALVRAQASNFKARGKTITVLDLLKLGIGFLSEYVEKKWTTALENKIGIAAAVEAQKTATPKAYAAEGDVGPKKRGNPTGGHDDFDKEPLSPAPKKKSNLAQAKLAKVDTRGMSKMESFFKKAK